MFSSGEDLVRKTPGFYVGATQRLNNDLGGSLAYAESHFGGQNLYLDELHKNINFVHEIAADPELSGLQRVPPDTITLT